MPKNYELAEPRAASLIEALRAVGYTLQTALADLIDNSITASATQVRIDFTWSGRDSSIAITDDGLGMSEPQLVDAMRPGTRSPLEMRSPNDLGRFGLGLKTASFSQARSLTVASRTRGGRISVRRWDLDYVGDTGEWRLLKSPAPGSEQKIAHLDRMDQGTLVLWEKLDRMVGNAPTGDQQAHDRFLTAAADVENHLGMVFHRFIGGSRPALRIYMNGLGDKNRIRAWDPFLESHVATFSPSEAETIRFSGRNITVKGFVLPHKDKLSENEFVAAAGPAGWNAQQGFYVYRNQRLLVPGSWLDLGYTNEEHYKLARIRVDIPNSSDADWAIDVKKSRARPPAALRQRLKELAAIVRNRAREIYVHRGLKSKGGSSEPLSRIWLSETKQNRLTYKLDRSHPLIRFVLSKTQSKHQRQSLNALLCLIEATVPIQQIWLDTAEKPEVHARPFEHEPPAHVREIMIHLYRALRAGGTSEELARQRLLNMEPFNSYPELVGSITGEED